MRKEVLEKWILQLDGMVAALDQATVIGERSMTEAVARDRLQDARLALIEAIEEIEEQEQEQKKGE
jgi:hypothetical protein